MGAAGSALHEGRRSLLKDPTLWLSVFCYLLAPFKGLILPAPTPEERRDESTTWSQRLRYFADPWLIVPWAVAFATAAATPARAALTVAEQRTANWYLFNGPVINMGLDGFSGVLSKIPLLRKLYCKADKRYRDHEAVVSVIGVMEMTLYPAGCLALYWAYWTGAMWRRPLEVAVATAQFYGTVMFIGTEAWNGYGMSAREQGRERDVVVDAKFEFTTHHITYFWFAYLLNYVWFAVPGYLGFTAARECTDAFRRVGAARSA